MVAQEEVLLREVQLFPLVVLHVGDQSLEAARTETVCLLEGDFGELRQQALDLALLLLLVLLLEPLEGGLLVEGVQVFDVSAAARHVDLHVELALFGELRNVHAVESPVFLFRGEVAFEGRLRVEVPQVLLDRGLPRRSAAPRPRSSARPSL